MKTKLSFLIPAISLILTAPSNCIALKSGSTEPLKIAVEFMDHAAAAYIAKNKGWFQEAGIPVVAYDNYITGMALGAAFARGDLDAAYLCLVPAVNVYANARVPIRIIDGTHKDGYGLVADPDQVKTVRDLGKPSTRIGCVREGGAADIIFNRCLEEYGLDKDVLREKTLRMNPPQLIMSIKTGRLDAAFLPEHYATLAESLGFQMLLESKEIWPDYQGSVLVATAELCEQRPDIVKKLAAVSRRATEWINHHPEEAAAIVTAELQGAEDRIFPIRASRLAKRLGLTEEVIRKSMARMEYTADLDPGTIQDIIDYMIELDYIPAGVTAEDVLH